MTVCPLVIRSEKIMQTKNIHSLFTKYIVFQNIHTSIKAQKFNNPYNKITGCLSVYLSVPKDLANAEPIGFSFTEYLLIGPGKIYNYFGGGYHQPP